MFPAKGRDEFLGYQGSIMGRTGAKKVQQNHSMREGLDYWTN